MDSTKISKRPLIFYAASCISIVIGVITLFTSFAVAKTKVDELATLCSESDPAFQSIQTNADSNTHAFAKVYVYDANPHEFLLGTGNLELIEKGPFSFRIIGTKLSPSIEGSYLKYVTWNKFEFSEEESCKGCLATSMVTVPNLGYNRVLTAAQNEGVLFLAGTCTATQIALSGTSATICTEDERGNASFTTCRCCAPYTFSGQTTCESLASPASSPVASMISLLAGFDGGITVQSDTLTAHGATRVVSPLFSTRTVRDIIMGHGSSMTGFLQIRSLTDDSATAQAIATYSKDFKAVCFMTCLPSLNAAIQLALASDNPFEILGSPSFVCNETAATVEELKRDGKEHLSYLAETSCKPISSLLLSYSLELTGGTASCLLEGETAPCCLTSGYNFNSTTNLRGLGCIFETPGVAVARRLETKEEATAFLLPETYQVTSYLGCNGPLTNESDVAMESSLQPISVILFRNEEKFPTWYDEDGSGEFMNQVDVNDVYSGNLEATSFAHVEGIEPRSINKIGLVWDDLIGGRWTWKTSDGVPSTDSFYAYSSSFRRTGKYVNTGSSEYEGIELARFQLNTSFLLHPAGSTGNGNPFDGIINDPMIQGLGKFLSFPNFAFSDPSLLNQSTNTHISASTPDGNGINLFTVVSEYEGGHSLRQDPVPITEGWIASHDFSSWTDYEPITGFAARHHARGMVGVHIWSCDSSDVASCALFASSSLDSDCYAIPAYGLSYGCSAANILTPYMTSRKFIPMLWIEESADIHPLDAEQLKMLLQLPLVGKIIFLASIVFSGIAVYVGVVMTKKLKEAQVFPMKDVEMI